MEDDNLRLQKQIQENVRNQEHADAKVEELLDILDNVGKFLLLLLLAD
jgi:hypothetical protein